MRIIMTCTLVRQRKFDYRRIKTGERVMAMLTQDLISKNKKNSQGILA